MAERLAIEIFYNRQARKFWIVELLDDLETSNKYIQKRHYSGKTGKLVSVTDFSSEDFNEVFAKYEKKILKKVADSDYWYVRNGDVFNEAPAGFSELIQSNVAREQPADAVEQNVKAYRKIKI